jgi:predicted lipid-binding transport protein (Tim44 family)/DNA-directed RNA polymerase subunit RPC12/RpoP
MKNTLKRLALLFSITCVLLLMPARVTFPRAGGGGGGHSSGGFHGGGGFHSSGGFHSGSHGSGSGSPVAAIIIIIIIIVVISAASKKKNLSNNFRTLAPKPLDKASGYSEFLKNNPDFNADAFYAKVKKAFADVQIAWSKGDIQSVRRFISDGVYQRFNTQLKMMSILKQRDIISDVTIENVFIDRSETDGAYDILHIGIRAGMSDQFICETMPELNSPGGYESFTEFWSFIRKRGSGKKDIYSTNNCPNCSAALPEKMGDSGKCQYCGAFVNSGEYDWILAEITQQDDYLYGAFASKKTPNLSAKVKELIGENADFAVEEIEDKASNGYLQILTAITLKDPSTMRRFVSDNAFDRLSRRITNENICYNRLYLNDVSLIGVRQENEKNILLIGVKSTYQRVNLISEDNARFIDPAMMTKKEVVVMERHIQTETSKGSLYAHLCSNCGAPLKDSLDVTCPYCSSVLNSSKNEWIISDILSMTEYENYYSQYSKDFAYKVDASLTDDLATIKDFAFNNMMILLASDGVFADDERKLAAELAKKWGFNVENIQPMFDMAMSGRLVIRMPEDGGRRKKIYLLMEKAANADGNISKQEQRLLDYIKETYLGTEN